MRWHTYGAYHAAWVFDAQYLGNNVLQNLSYVAGNNWRRLHCTSETSNYSSGRFIQGLLLYAPNVSEGIHKAEATQGDWSNPYIWHVNLENGRWSYMLRGWGFGSYWTFVEQKHWTFSLHMTCAFLQPWKSWTSVYVLGHRRASSLLVRIITNFK